MGYDIHAVRTEDWLDASEKPITKEEIQDVIPSDQELAWSEDYVDMADDTANVTRYLHDCLVERSVFGGTKIRFSAPRLVERESLGCVITAEKET